MRAAIVRKETAFHSAEEPEAEAGSYGRPRTYHYTIPLDKVKVGNLTNLLDAKAPLIKHALHRDLRFELDEDSISFPGSRETPESDGITPPSALIAMLCKIGAREQKQISATRKAGRWQTLRIPATSFFASGFIGDGV